MRSLAAKASYKGSLLQKRNLAAARAKALAPARKGDEAASEYLALARVTTARELCGQAASCGEQIDLGREAHLLVPDELNGGYTTIAIYDHGFDTVTAELCSLDVHAGELLVPSDTLVYWK